MDTVKISSILSLISFVNIFFATYIVGRAAFLYGKSITDISDDILEWTKNLNDTRFINANRGNKIKAKLSKKGYMYRFQDYELTPSTYMMLKIVVAILVAIAVCVFFGFNALTFVIAAIIGYFALDIIFNFLNKLDNDNMAEDIQNLYFTLIVHSEAGVHIVDSIRMCITETSNKRLREAFNEFVNIVSTNRGTITDAINIFNSRFDNNDITNICIVMKQAEETGRSAKMINDLLIQVDNSQQAKNYEIEKSQERKMMLILVAFIAGILGMFLIGLVNQVNLSIINF